MRRTVLLEVEFEGSYADPFALRDEVRRIRDGQYLRVVKAEIVKEETGWIEIPNQ
jgi:hypothetical protein